MAQRIKNDKKLKDKEKILILINDVIKESLRLICLIGFEFESEVL